MAWLILIVAGLFEVAWAVAMKQSAGFTRLWPTVLTAVAMLASVALLSWSMRSLPLGTAYAVWTGIGIVGTVVVGIFMFAEAASFVRLFCVFLILAGIIGLKLVTPARP